MTTQTQRHPTQPARVETRAALRSRMEVRTADGKITFSGIASRTGTRYDMGPYEESVKPGAFAETLSQPDLDVMLLIAHSGLPIARTRAGSLHLTETDRGLEFTATASADDPDAAQIAAKIRSGLVSEASMAFRVTDQKWSDDRTHRELRKLDLHRGDVSICAFGANPATSVDVRARRRLPGNLSLYRSRALALSLGASRRERS